MGVAPPVVVVVGPGTVVVGFVVVGAVVGAVVGPAPGRHCE